MQKWIMKTKENMEEHELLFLKAHQSPIFNNISVLETYKHESHLGADLRKIVSVKDVKNVDMEIGWEAYGLTVPYGYQLTDIAVPRIQDMMILSEYILAYASKQITVTTHCLLPFLLGKTIQDTIDTEHLSKVSNYCMSNLQLNKFTMNSLN